MTDKPLFKRVVQIGLVVRNVEQTAKRCSAEFGMGPWTFYTYDPSCVGEMTVHGRRIDHAMKTAHTLIGDIDWELIEPLDEKSIYFEHLRSHGEGLHHILFDVEDYSATKATLQSQGHRELASGVWLGNPFGYFDTTSTLACITELWTPPRDPQSARQTGP